MPEDVSLTDHDSDGGAEPDLSLAEHAAQFGPGAAQAPPAATNGAEPEGEPVPPTNGTGEGQGERDAQGRFRPQRPRHAASPDDVPLIAELTKRIKEAEAAVDAQPKPGESTRVFELRRRAEIAEARRDALKAPAATISAPVPRPPESVPRAIVQQQATPKPSVNDFQDYSDYIEALTDWKTDQKLAAATERWRQEADAQRLSTSWRDRVTDARAEYPDFDAVAFHTETLFPEGSTIDRWILKHKAGAKVLYHLQRSPAEVNAILALPDEDEQREALALFTQRLSPSQTVSSSSSPQGAVSSSSSRAQAGSTGSAAAPQTPVAPRPPNPVRTGPMKTADEPPGDDDMSLVNHERYWPPARHR